MTNQTVIGIACQVFESSIRARFENTPITFLEYGLHSQPRKLNKALQEVLDNLPEPSLVLLVYGLCGNGLHGLRSGRHRLIVPRVDDCIAMFLGSREAYLRQFQKAPGTYYLTKGWLESGSHPLRQYREYADKYGEETAGWLMDTEYHNYKRLAFVSHTQEDLKAYRPQVAAVAEFCRSRWGFEYEEILGSDDLLRRLAEAPRRLEKLDDEFLVIPPGSRVDQSMFSAATG
jgi:hypothetical protein